MLPQSVRGTWRTPCDRGRHAGRSLLCSANKTSSPAKSSKSVYCRSMQTNSVTAPLAVRAVRHRCTCGCRLRSSANKGSTSTHLEPADVLPFVRSAGQTETQFSLDGFGHRMSIWPVSKKPSPRLRHLVVSHLVNAKVNLAVWRQHLGS